MWVTLERGLNSQTGFLLPSVLVVHSWVLCPDVKLFLYTVLRFLRRGCFYSSLHSCLSKWGKMCRCQQMHVCWRVAGGPVPDRWEHKGWTCVCPLLHCWKQKSRAHPKSEPAHLHLVPTEPVQCQKPCRNGGVCVGFNRCRCAKGFTGEVCETGQCATHTCAGFTPLCLFLLMFLFPRPVAVTTPCIPPCQHGATCSPHNTCTCPEGTTGLRCQRLWVSIYRVVS